MKGLSRAVARPTCVQRDPERREQLWRITKNIDEPDQRVCQALIALIAESEQVKKRL